MLNPFSKEKKFIGEAVAEWSIRIIASASIVIIFLIFFFVFREAATLFIPNSENETEQSEVTNDGQGATPGSNQQFSANENGQDVYNPSEASGENSQTTTTSGQDTYTANSNGQDSYGETESGQESYGETKDGQESYGETGIRQESYGEGQSGQESYGEDLAEADSEPGSNILTPLNMNYPEIYNPETGSLPADINTVEGYAAPTVDHEAPSLWTNLLGDMWQPVGEQSKFGVVPLLIGTTKTTAVAILFGAPLGILAAIFTAFFAPRRLREIIKPTIEMLAGFPSVVIGFFCLVTVATFIQQTFDATFRLNAIVGGIGLSLAVIPIVYAIAEDALSAVPKNLREASLALGSTQWQTAYRVMLPAAAPGVFAAVLLGIGRAFGETMIAIMATGNAPMTEWSISTPARTFAATIGSEMGEVVWGSEHYGVLFLLGTFLFVVSFSLNAITELYVKKRLIKRFQGK